MSIAELKEIVPQLNYNFHSEKEGHHCQIKEMTTSFTGSVCVIWISFSSTYNMYITKVILAPEHRELV